jgi:hypothetical protein
MVDAAHERNLPDFVVFVILFDAEIVDPAMVKLGKAGIDDLQYYFTANEERIGVSAGKMWCDQA